MRQFNLLTRVSVCALAFAFTAAGNAQEALPEIDVGAVMAPGPVTAPIAPPPSSPPLVADELGHTAKPFSGSYVPASVAHVGDVVSVTKQEIDQTVNVMTSAELIQNLPSTLVRERFIGDRNATIEGRINNPQDSARTMLYADGVLLSNYLGNSYAYPPRWNMVAPVEIQRVDAMEGPFSALYGGNSESGVYTITTRMPEHFEFHAEGNSSVQYFTWFQDKETDLSGHMSLAVGDRMENFSYWLIYDRLDRRASADFFSKSIQSHMWIKVPVGVRRRVCPLRGGRYGPNGFPTPGGTLGDIAGSAGADHSEQHFGKVKLAYDVTPATRLTWQTGFWSLVDNTFVHRTRYTTNGIPLYGLGSGVKINDGPFGSYALRDGSNALERLAPDELARIQERHQGDFRFRPRGHAV